jgi:NAD(P)-binding Rossmann-like domain
MRAASTVRIAGAGLSGLSTAIGLARLGHGVDVFEKNADSGMLRHADWDAIENWTTEQDLFGLLSQWGIMPTFEYRTPFSFEVYNAKGECQIVTLRQPLFYLASRGSQAGSVEQALKAQALDHGVRIHYNCPRDQGEVDVWAAGARSASFFLGAGLTFRSSHSDIVMILVDTFLAPKAYAYLVIVDGFGTLSTVLTRDFNQARTYLNRCMQAFRRYRSFDMNDVKMSSGFGGLVSAIWKPITRPLVVGEAGGFQDFLWGFGIRHALHTGHLAARALDKGMDFEQLVKSEVRPLVRASLLNRALYDWAGNRTYGILIRYFASLPDLAKHLRGFYRGSILERIFGPFVERRYRYGG